MNTSKIIGIIAVTALILSVVGLIAKDSATFGGATHFSGPLDSAAGFTESSVTVIDTDRNLWISGNINASGTARIAGESLFANITFGSGYLELNSTDTMQTLTAAQVCDYGVIGLDTSGANATLTVPDADSLVGDCLETRGGSHMFQLVNLGGEHITINAAGYDGNTEADIATGTELFEPSGGDVIIEDTEIAWIIFTYSSTTDATVTATVWSIQDAD